METPQRSVNGIVLADHPWVNPEVTSQWDELLAAYYRDRGLCGLCGQPVDLTVPRGPKQPTIDHIVPFSKGGLDSRENIQLAHRGCNSWKGGRDLGEGGAAMDDPVVECTVDVAAIIREVERQIAGLPREGPLKKEDVQS